MLAQCGVSGNQFHHATDHAVPQHAAEPLCLVSRHAGCHDPEHVLAVRAPVGRDVQPGTGKLIGECLFKAGDLADRAGARAEGAKLGNKNSLVNGGPELAVGWRRGKNDRGFAVEKAEAGGGFVSGKRSYRRSARNTFCAASTQTFVYRKAAALETELLDVIKAAGVKVNNADNGAFIKASKPIYDEFASSVEGGAELIKTVQGLAN